MKLWQKENTQTADLVEQFTVGKDRDFDLLLAEYDVLGSLAHTAMLADVGLLSAAEKEQIHAELNGILEAIRSGSFAIEPDVEDIHSQIELMLTRSIGETGKKIHSGRSRNDQVAVDIKLYLKQALKDIAGKTFSLFDTLLSLSEKHRQDLLPGYTHLQIAMPSSFGLWFGAYAESLTDDLELLSAAYTMADKNPLGSGAGYGSSFPLDRSKTTTALGFSDMHYNSVYAQMSRGKTEKFVATGIAAIAATLARFAIDICLFMSQNFGFIQFPSTLTTGSSIMPHKKNPDIFELVRGKCNRLQALPNEFALLLTNLPSGYHRELQLTKEILFPGITTLNDCLDILLFALPQIQVTPDILLDEKYKYLFTVEAVSDLVREGQSFREAYRSVGEQVELNNFQYGNFDISRHTHEGSMGNLCNDRIARAMKNTLKKFG
ncbi:MAG: argininosuccinate lyase [Sphingobacteriales bacterium]|nr:MAG: argininosuccinate lyase [Sphingobacteriales bacterium]